jgi:predicted ester cyclase
MKKALLVVSLVILFSFTFSCQNKAEKAELEKFRAQAKLEEQNKELILRWFEEDAKGNYDIWGEVCSPDYKAHYPSIAKSITLEEHLQMWKMFKEAFPDIKETVAGIIAKGDKVILRLTIRGTHTGEFMGIQPTGKEFEYSAIEVYRIYEGKVVEVWGEADNLGLNQQLGMELKPKEVKK